MKIYNSYTDKLEEFVPIKENEVTMYVCGPTVYNYVHIGNMRPVITFDMVANYFKYLGYEVVLSYIESNSNLKVYELAIDNLFRRQKHIQNEEVTIIFRNYVPCGDSLRKGAKCQRLVVCPRLEL